MSVSVIRFYEVNVFCSLRFPKENFQKYTYCTILSWGQMTRYELQYCKRNVDWEYKIIFI